MSLRCFLLLIVLPAGALANGTPVPKRTSVPTCPYPGAPINWILAYCAREMNTGDEIALQNSPCFQKAEKDLSQKDECAINKKYKTKVCRDLAAKDAKHHSSIQDCLKDQKVEPFYAGG
ncbi:hypothetical protein [Oligoflexus tunisiensis]|uniref:hypothetical protein n=1 Tax=Oligoflexus tunisiensis TaxID=708132 RepID=UPI00114CFF5C|nr:hypothetical protein [Oligoflexus tunisiensis]